MLGLRLRRDRVRLEGQVWCEWKLRECMSAMEAREKNGEVCDWKAS